MVWLMILILEQLEALAIQAGLPHVAAAACHFAVALGNVWALHAMRVLELPSLADDLDEALIPLDVPLQRYGAPKRPSWQRPEDPELRCACGRPKRRLKAQCWICTAAQRVAS